MIKVMIDNKGFKRKPAGSTAGSIQKRLMNTNKRTVESITELAEALEKGLTVRPGVLAVGSKEAKDFEGASTIFIDVDSYSKDAIENTKKLLKANGLDASIIYKSFSYEEVDTKATKNKKANPYFKKLKYNHRVVFKLEEDIIDADMYCEAMSALIALLGGDEACKDAGRLMYGAKEVVEVSEIAVLSKDKLAEIMKMWKKKLPSEPRKASRSKRLTALKEPRVTATDIYIDVLVNICRYIDSRKNEAISGLEGSFEHKLFRNNNNIDVKEFIRLCYLMPLDEILEVEGDKAFNCIFHDDSHASATIKFHHNKSTYKCFSGCVEGSLDIFHLISIGLTGTKDNFHRALMWIADKIGVSFKITNWKIAQQMIISDNSCFINHIDDLKKIGYNDLYKALNTETIIRVYRILLNYAQETLGRTLNIEEDEDLIVQISLSKLSGELRGKDTGYLNNIMGYLASIRVIDKVSDIELKEKYPNQWKRACKLREVSAGDRTIDAYRMNRMTIEHISLVNALEAYRKASGMAKRANRITDEFIGVTTKSKAGGFTEAEKEEFNAINRYYKERLRKYGYIELKKYNAFTEKIGIKKDKAKAYLPLINKEHDCLKVTKKELSEKEFKGKKIKLSKLLNHNSTLFTNI